MIGDSRSRNHLLMLFYVPGEEKPKEKDRTAYIILVAFRFQVCLSVLCLAFSHVILYSSDEKPNEKLKGPNRL